MQISQAHTTITRLVTKDLTTAVTNFEAIAATWQETADLLDQALKNFGDLENALCWMTAETESIMQRVCKLEGAPVPK